MIEQVKKFLDKYEIKNKKVIVGFSGGPDSVSMAFVLSQLAKEYNLELILAYFNHNWRPAEAIAEIDFSFDFAKKINALFYTKKAPENSIKTEEKARELRYAFFEEAMRELNSDVVFLAHNKNDNVETLIYRIIKGTAITGLCSIPEKRENYYRPLLKITKEQIFDFLNKNNLKYMIDSSNDDTKYKRNLIRKKILPLFDEINPNYMTNIENLIKNAISTREIIDEELKNLKAELIEDNAINREKYISKTKALRYEFLNDFVKDKLKCHNYKNIKKIDDFILNNKNSQISVNKELFLKIKRNKIFYIECHGYD